MNKVLALLLVGSFAIVAALTLQGCGSKEEVMEDPIIDLEEIEQRDALTGEDIPQDVIPDDTIYIEPTSREFANIHFEFDQFRILDEDKATLEAIAGWMREYPEARVLIEGHCDERGTNEYNMALGEQRALAARRYLVSLGIDSGRLNTVSYGEDRPLDLGSTEAAWAMNRRAHFAVSM